MLSYNGVTYTEQEVYEKFLTGINSKRVLANIQQVWTTINVGINTFNPSVSADEANKIVSDVVVQREAIYSEVSMMGVTKEEVDALHVITNIDYFEHDSNNKAAFIKLYGETFDLNKNLYLAESAIKKILDYNASVKDFNNKYNFTHFIIDSKEGIYTLLGLMNDVNLIYSKDSSATSVAYKLIKYAAYSDEAFIGITVGAKDNEEFLALDKNSLTLGINDLVNKILYYTFTDNSDILYTQQVTDMMNLTDGTQAISMTQEQMMLMVNSICLEQNEVLDTYEIGHLEEYATLYKSNEKVYTYDNSK